MADGSVERVGRSFLILAMIAFMVPFVIAMSNPIISANDSQERMESLPGFTMQDLATNSFWTYNGSAQGANVSVSQIGTYWYPQSGIILNALTDGYSTDANAFIFSSSGEYVKVFIVHNGGDPNAQDDYARYSNFLVVSQQWGLWDFQYKVYDLNVASYDYNANDHGVSFHVQLKEKMTVWLKADSASNIQEGTFTVYVGQSLTDQAQGSNDIFGMLASAISMSWTTGNDMLDWAIKLPLVFAYVYVAFILITRLIPFT